VLGGGGGEQAAGDEVRGGGSRSLTGDTQGRSPGIRRKMTLF
jgi:hypothetical protein